MVERFFSKMTKQMLNGIRVTGKEELENRIYKYFEEINEVPISYHWSYSLDDIDLEKKNVSQIVYEVVQPMLKIRISVHPYQKQEKAVNRKSRLET